MIKLAPDVRTDMLGKVLQVARVRLLAQKRKGVLYREIADTIGLPKTRISEIMKGVYIGKKTIGLLIAHGYLDVDDLASAAHLTDEQVAAVASLARAAQSKPDLQPHLPGVDASAG